MADIFNLTYFPRMPHAKETLLTCWHDVCRLSELSTASNMGGILSICNMDQSHVACDNFPRVPSEGGSSNEPAHVSCSKLLGFMQYCGSWYKDRGTRGRLINLPFHREDTCEPSCPRAVIISLAQSALWQATPS